MDTDLPKCIICKRTYPDDDYLYRCSCGDSTCFQCIIEDFISQVRTIPVETQCATCHNPLYHIRDAIAELERGSTIDLLCKFGCSGQMPASQPVVIYNILYHVIRVFEHIGKLYACGAAELIKIVDDWCADLGGYECREPAYGIYVDEDNLCPRCEKFLNDFRDIYDVLLPINQ